MAPWRCSGGAASLMVVLLCVLAGCDATQQQQQQQHGISSAMAADEVFSLIERVVQQELRPIVESLARVQSSSSKLESRVESLDSRLTLLDSRVSGLITHTLSGRQSQPIGRLSGRLDSLQTQLTEVTAQMNGQKSQQEELMIALGNHTTQLDALATRLENIEPQLTGLAARLDSHQSEVNALTIQLNGQVQQDQAAVTVVNHTARLDDYTAQLDNIGLKLDSHGSQLAELTLIHESQQTESAPVRDETIDQTSVQQTVVDQPAAKTSVPRDCSDLPARSPTGIYLTLPSGDSQQPPVQAYCDMDSVGGNWTVFQRRDDIQPRQDFYLGWKEYKEGFGNLTGEFWWGLENIYQLTSSTDRRYELRIELEDLNGNQAFAVYQGFSVSSEDDGYRLSASDYTGTAGDGLRTISQRFSTRDRDQDEWHDSCAQAFRGAWWYDDCGPSSLNGPYRDEYLWDLKGIWWTPWRGLAPLKKTEMKMRPV